MFTSKVKALDSEDSEEDEMNSSGTPTVTREALEQKALLQYQEALQMERAGRFTESEKMLKTLLESHILKDCNISKADASQRTSFSHLKYCVTLNLAHCLVNQEKLEEALDFYLSASRIEDTDLNLWYKMGTVAVKLPDLRLAATAFAEGLKISPKHWGCIDNIVTVLYALGDFLTCLYFIVRGLEMDSGFVKGHVFKKAILYQSPFLRNDFSLYYPGSKLKEEVDEDIDKEIETQLLSEADILSKKERQCWSIQPIFVELPPCKLSRSLTWLQLASNMLHKHQIIFDEDPKRIVYQVVEFDSSVPMEISVSLDPVKESSHSEASGESVKPEDETNDQTKGGTYEKWLSCQKRRSARVRSTVRREEPSLARSLAHLIPTHLLQRNQNNGLLSEDSLETMDLYRLFESKELDETKTYRKNIFSPEERKKLLSEEGYFNSNKEVEDVKNFMSDAVRNQFTIIDCIKECISKLSVFWNLLWPENLAKIFIQMFKLMMKYNPPNLCRGNDLRTVVDDLSILMYGELLLDKWVENGKEKGKPGPLGTTLLGGEFSSLYLGALDHRVCVSSDPQLLARIYWLQGMLFYYIGEVEPTTSALEVLLYENWFQDLEVKLPNIHKHYLISNVVVSDILKSLNINKGLSKVMEFYQSECYEDVVDILSESLLSEQLVASSGSKYIISKNRQFSLLIDSLWKLSKFRECFFWSECFLFDCLLEYKNSTVEDDRASNARCIISLLDGILAIIDTVGHIVFGTLPLEKQSRFVQTLSSIICLQMDVPETTTEMCIESIAPWLLLYHAIKYDEDSKMKSADVSCLGVRIEEDKLSASLSVLLQGHDYLGRRGWCCFNEGSLLYFSLDVMYPLLETLNTESKTLSQVNQEIDQIFFCLYGHKKSKGRHLVNHKTLGLALTWNRACQVFRFTKLKELPSYESSAKCSINSDSEAIYLKLISCVPEQCDPSRLISEMTKYLEGEADELPQNICQLPDDITNIYYLLADYYFKNKLWNKALKFSVLDVCANPSRVDSWACLALARGSLIDIKINSCDAIKNENEVLKSADIVTRCYDRSLRLDPLQSTLWIEKGSFSYTMHSFCSNLLKKEVNLSLEMFDILENKKDAMLGSAMDSFCKANKIWYSCKGLEIHDERWLHHYMMGKICEKKGETPQIFIDHYLKAAEFLHEMGALYPSCISYAAPQRLAVESLEIYYRIHASTLKFLEKYECKEVPKDSFLVYRSAVTKMAERPFINLCQSSKEEVAKVDICPIKETKTAVTDDSYLTESNSQSLFKTHEVNIKNEANIKDDNSYQESSIKVEILPSPSKNQSNNQNQLSQSIEKDNSDNKPILPLFNKEINLGLITHEPKPNIKSQSKETESDKRTLSIESDNHTTSDSVSKASGVDKPSKSSDSSSDDSSSSDSDSSSDSSSSDSSSSSSDQDSESNQDHEKNKTGAIEPPKPIDWDVECDKLTKDCLQAMEVCSSRFKEHFKSLYHLAHFYFKSKKCKDLMKVKKILLETGGLFVERKSSNFFNGIWRIPNNEIDRPGNFAAHMGRCTQLLLEYLKETRDYKMLIDLALFLKLVPEPDKKYLRDTEREELCHEALSLAAISMRKRLAEIFGEDFLKPLLVDVFCIYKKVSRSCLKEPVFAAILSECFFKLTGQKSENNLEADVQSYLKKDQVPPEKIEKLPIISGSISIEPIPPAIISKPAPTPPAPLIPPAPSPVVTSLVVPPSSVPPPQIAPLDLQTKASSAPIISNTRVRSTGPKRPRGRPPGSLSQPLRHSISSILQQRPDMFLPVDPFRPKLRPSLSITPVTPRPRKPRASQARPQVPIPVSISITSVTPQPRAFSFQSVSFTPRPRLSPAEPKLPPATIIPLPLQQQTVQSKSRPRCSVPATAASIVGGPPTIGNPPKIGQPPKIGPSPPKIGPSPPKIGPSSPKIGHSITKVGPPSKVGPPPSKVGPPPSKVGPPPSKVGPPPPKVGLPPPPKVGLPPPPKVGLPHPPRVGLPPPPKVGLPPPPKVGAPSPKIGPPPKVGPLAPKVGPSSPKVGAPPSKIVPPPQKIGPPPPKIPHLDFNVAQAIRNLGSTITITTSTGESSRSKTSGNSQPTSNPLSKSAVPQSSRPPPPPVVSSSTTQKDPNIQVIILDD